MEIKVLTYWIDEFNNSAFCIVEHIKEGKSTWLITESKYVGNKN